jgi:nitrate reductase gamma subunit
MIDSELLLWIRGPAFHYALIIFLLGSLVRVLGILLLGRKPNFAEARGSAMVGGLSTIATRMVPDRGTWLRSMFTITAGYVFHIGLFVVVFFFSPHILVVHELTGLSWAGLPSPIIDALTVVTMITLLAVLFYRIASPVLRLLSRGQDYLVWAVTFLPVLTGYLAMHRMFLPPPTLIGLHMISVELLLVLFPFTKLTHAFTLVLARWYNGAISGYRGVQS